MQPELNPFVPGSGLRPPALVGRDSEIAAFDLLIARTRARRAGRSLILHGLRGVGKTVLLNNFRDQAERAEWFIVEVEGRATDIGKEAIRLKLGRAFLNAASKASRSTKAGGALKAALGSVKSFSVSLGVMAVEIGVNATPGRSDSGRLEIDLDEMIEDLAPALKEDSSAIGIFIDEMQDLDGELLSALLAVQHRAGQKGWPFYIVGAGLPDLPATLSSAKSYAERLFDYRRIGALDDVAARAALAEPVRAHGADFEPAALVSLLDAAAGYPYFLQTFGASAWDAARGRLITQEDAEAAITVGQEALDMGFYPARWDRVSSGEKRYLRAMADTDDVLRKTSEIVRLLGSSLSTQSGVRQSLIAKGFIYAPERGSVSFTVPGMASYIRRQFSD